MKSPIKVAIIVVLISVLVISLFSIIAFQPSFSELFNFTDKDKASVSTVINNIATPCISLISIILLFITLNKQQESIVDQRKSKNLDLILTSINNMEAEYSSISYLKNIGNGNHQELFGFDAIMHSVKLISSDPIRFGKSYKSDQFRSFTIAFDFVNDLILTLELDELVKEKLIKRVDLYYETKVKVLFLELAFVIKDFEDINSKTIVNFVINQEKKNNNKFDLYKYQNVGELLNEFQNYAR